MYAWFEKLQQLSGESDLVPYSIFFGAYPLSSFHVNLISICGQILLPGHEARSETQIVAPSPQKKPLITLGAPFDFTQDMLCAFAGDILIF